MDFIIRMGKTLTKAAPTKAELVTLRDRLAHFRQQHKTWNAPGHRLRIALDKLRTLDRVRTIESQT